ncbi:hypothetical protein FPOAC2_10023 [Fusarium poae]|uniref:3'-5' exonuclease domain-containing protein n=1 Tax=Fusarium poae TaxID=36050 RepID=A0A1B8AQP4_FUSPO|nr:hypothetical protein FPOAC1_010078 [Fusarium poae]KAG8670645.1 hypothetical protein FPOAC1_010078 [Fusarium poae]OBS22843.1 hypothetical protein FPOA_09166 [Fusarium poae]
MATTAVPPTLVASLPDLLAFISSIPQSSTLYLDLEGKDLSRNGTLTIITILIHPTRATSLIDVQTLGHSAFTTPGANGKTLKAILEDPCIPKRLWDVRNDADALWSHHQVRLAGVMDIQLLENATRIGDRTYVRGLDICVDKDLRLEIFKYQRWTRIKREVRDLMHKDIFSHRPLDAKTIQYCVNDVVHLPALYNTYTKRINRAWMKKVTDESTRRVEDACGPSYEPQSETKRLGPWGLASGKKLLSIDDYEWSDQLEEDEMQQGLLGRDMDEESCWYP